MQRTDYLLQPTLVLGVRRPYEMIGGDVGQMREIKRKEARYLQVEGAKLKVSEYA
jgi:hypothetical protein